jgi:hypothetical protein
MMPAEVRTGRMKAAPGVGRAAGTDVTRAEELFARLTPKERKAVGERAEQNVMSVADYARRAFTPGEPTDPSWAPILTEGDGRAHVSLRGELVREGTNLNQMA